MYCPACTEERLLITERSGIEIDYRHDGLAKPKKKKSFLSDFFEMGD